MKMEVEVRSKKAGVVIWIFGEEEQEWEEGVDVREGTLICELEDVMEERAEMVNEKERGRGSKL